MITYNSWDYLTVISDFHNFEKEKMDNIKKMQLKHRFSGNTGINKCYTYIVHQDEPALIISAWYIEKWLTYETFRSSVGIGKYESDTIG